MRKMTVEFTPKDNLTNIWGRMLENVDSYHLLELLRLDFEHGIKVGLCEIRMREGYTIDDVELPEPIEMLTVLKRDGERYICLVKVQVPAEFRAMMRKFDMDLIWDSPTYVSEGRFLTTVVGEQEDLVRYLKLMKPIAEVGDVTIVQATFDQQDLLSVLTERQRDMIIAAKQYGYFDYPRRMNAEELSKRVGVSKATFLEHLRKAEGRLMSTLLAGY